MYTILGLIILVSIVQAIFSNAALLTAGEKKLFGMPLPGKIALRAASDCLLPGTLAIRETPGRNNFGKWIKIILGNVGLSQGAPWCMAFIVTRLIKAAAALGLVLPKGMPRTGATWIFANWGKKAGLWIPMREIMANPGLVQHGDIVFFYKRSLLRIGHVGMVVRQLRNHKGNVIGLVCVEGNTGPDGGRDGDGVYLKEREYAEFGDPNKSGVVRFPF